MQKVSLWIGIVIENYSKIKNILAISIASEEKAIDVIINILSSLNNDSIYYMKGIEIST